MRFGFADIFFEAFQQVFAIGDHILQIEGEFIAGFAEAALYIFEQFLVRYGYTYRYSCCCTRQRTEYYFCPVFHDHIFYLVYKSVVIGRKSCRVVKSL